MTSPTSATACALRWSVAAPRSQGGLSRRARSWPHPMHEGVQLALDDAQDGHPRSDADDIGSVVALMFAIAAQKVAGLGQSGAAGSLVIAGPCPFLRPAFPSRTEQGYPDRHAPSQPRIGADSSVGRSWYSLQRWRTRTKHQLRIEPLCALVSRPVEITPGDDRGSSPPPRPPPERVHAGVELRSLCKACHDGLSGFVHKGYSSAIGVDGYPIDPAHPFNRRRKGHASKRKRPRSARARNVPSHRPGLRGGKIGFEGALNEGGPVCRIVECLHARRPRPGPIKAEATGSNPGRARRQLQ